MSPCRHDALPVPHAALSRCRHVASCQMMPFAAGLRHVDDDAATCLRLMIRRLMLMPRHATPCHTTLYAAITRRSMPLLISPPSFRRSLIVIDDAAMLPLRGDYAASRPLRFSPRVCRYFFFATHAMLCYASDAFASGFDADATKRCLLIAAWHVAISPADITIFATPLLPSPCRHRTGEYHYAFRFRQPSF